MKKKVCLLLGSIILFTGGGLVALFLFSPDSEYKDIQILFFAGGSKDFYFSKPLYEGARQAAEDLGAQVKFYWSDWNVDKMLLQFKAGMEEHPDGIVIMGHPGEMAFAPLIDEAFRRQILVTSINVNLPSIEEKYASQGFGYAGQNPEKEGILMAKGFLRKFTPPRNRPILVTGVKKIPLRGDRTRGIENTLRDKGYQVIYIEDTLPLSNFDNKVKEVLDAHREIQFILDDIDPHYIAGLLRRLGYPRDRFILGGFNLAPETYRDLKEGYLHLILDQQPFLQGYLGVLQICLTRRYELPGMNINTGAGFYDEYNLEQAEYMLKLMGQNLQ